MVDLLILGGGPAGYRAAERAAAGGLTALLFERRAVGGVCLNEGCIPTKALLHTAKLYDYVCGGAAPYGVSCRNPALDYAAAVRRKDKVVKKLTMGIEQTLKKRGVDIVRGQAVIKGRTVGGFAVEAGGSEYSGKNLLICAGSESVLPPIKGIETALTVREALSLTEVPASLAVIGGGIVGLEMASLFNSAGSRVTVWEAADRISGPPDREISDTLQKIYEKKGVAFRLNAAVRDIAELDADKALVCAGRKPVTAGFGLETLGVAVERGAVVTDGRMRSNIPGVFAAGDVNGKSMLAHTAYREAEVAVNTILGREDEMDYDIIPSVIYTNPEAASIGETAESARAKGVTARETRLPMAYSGRFAAENERGEAALCKLVWDGDPRAEDTRPVGAHLLGNPAGEIISAMSVIMACKMTAGQIRRLVFPHPTVGEIIKEAAFL